MINRDDFENKLKPVLLWMGTIVAVIMAIAYVIAVFILIEGFKVEKLLNTTIFSIITAAIGFCIMQMLKIQGQSFAANLEENVTIVREFNRNRIDKIRKYHSMTYFWVTSCISDIALKCITLAVASIGMVYIMIEGSGDYNLLFLAAVNLLMFAGFGLISLVKAYDFYNDEYIPYMLDQTKEAKKDEEINKVPEESIQ